MFPFFLTMPPFIVRITVVLAYALVFPFVMAGIAFKLQSNTVTGFLPLVFISAFVVGYFYPSVEAYLRDSPNLVSIAVLNVFLGWTLLGWVAALVWATKSESGSAGNGASVQQDARPNNTRACPYCAEEILKAAIICKHCRSDVSEKDQT